MSSSDPPRPSATLAAFRWVLLTAGVAVPAFWLMYRSVDPGYYDPLGLRLGYGGLMFALLGATYASAAVRRAVWPATLVVSSALVAYFTWLGVRNGLDGPWTVGVLVAASATVLAISPYARTVREAVTAVVALSAPLYAVLLLADAPADGGTLVAGYHAVLAVLAGAAAVAQVRTRQALKAQRDEFDDRGRLLRTVIDAIPMHVYVKNREGRCLIRNQFSADYMGLDDPEDAVGLTVFDTSEDPEVAAGYWEEEDRVMRTGEPDLDHEEPYAYDGERGWIVSSRVPLRDETGAVTGMVGVFRDVTAEKEAHAAVLEAREESDRRRRLLLTVLDAIPDTIFATDSEGTFILQNEPSLQDEGLEPMIGKTVFDLFPPALAEVYHGHNQEVMRTGKRKDLEHSFTAKTGEERVHLTSKVRLLGADGAPAGIVGISRDVTEQKRAEAALREAKEAAEVREREVAEQKRLLQTLIDAIPDAIYVLDAERRFQAVNRGAAYTFDRPFEEIIGRTPDELFSPGFARAFERSDRAAIASSDPVHQVEHDFAMPDGRVVQVHTTRVVLRDADGGVEGIVGVSRDVTEQKQAEAALIEAKEAAEAATRAKSEFLANMSHEIRTPMNGVIGMTSLLLDTALDREQRDFVETIRTSGDALLTIINDILDFSKIEAGMLALEVHPFEVRTCVEEALDLVAQAAAEKGVELAYLVEDGVPRTVRGDVTRVRQVLVNLLSNAVKFTPSGSVCVRVEAAPPDPAAGTVCQVRFAVEDTGIGIAPDKLDLVFESFSQADASTTRQFGGTGLGLAICQSLVSMMGGEMGVESEVGVGSTFRFSVAAEVAPSEKRVFLRSEQPALQGRRVLVVDDNDVNREILTRLSTRWRMRPEAVSRGAAALEAVEKAAAEGRPYDLVLLDMQMPEMDGLDVARGIRARTADRGGEPVLVMLTSIHREGALRTEAREAGIDAFLYKPTKPSQLYDVLIEAFDGRPAATDGTVSGEAAAPPAEPANDAPPVAWVARPPAEAPDGPPLRILLAEDNVVNQKVAVRLLGRLGHAADVVANGAEAVAEVERRAAFGEGYDVVFMDVQMPEMDGLEATRAIRASADVADQPHVIALTANAMEGDREVCLAAGADDYLSKPVQLAGMREALDRAVGARRAARV